MNHFLRITLLVFLGNSVWGQANQNPFDLKYRKAKSPVVREQKQSVLQRDTLKESLTFDSAAHTPKETDAVVPESPEKRILEDIEDTELNQQNPFETAGTSDTITVNQSGSAAETNEEKSDPVQPVPGKQYVSRGFQTFFLLLSILFLIFIVNVERSFIRDLWRVISNENYSSLHHRNQRNTMRQILLLMGYLIFIFQAGLFINQGLQIYPLTDSALSSIWVSIGVVLGVYLVRHGVIRFLKWLFNNEKELSLFSFDISIFNTMVGLILLPINILLVFGPDTFYNALVIIGLVVIGAAYLMRQIRWLFVSRRLIVNSLFLFFIYLCAVEILPLWTISKIFW